jgi:LysR family hydrogen peroxide-inducible transcriptional activator
MELHQLQYFIAVAETGGFSRAARRCRVTQPSLSQQIIKLETELGHRLFDRVGRSIKLTAVGAALLPRAQRVLTEVQAIRDGSADVDADTGRLAVGMIPTLAPFLLPATLRRFRRRFPRATVEVVEHTTDHLLQGLVSFELDVCFFALPMTHPLIEVETVFAERLMLAIPPGHELAKQDAPMLDMLRGIPFIALNEEHCLSQQIDRFCYERHVHPHVVCRSANLSTVHSCVAAGLGVALVPALMADGDRTRTCIYRPLADATPGRTIVAGWHARRARSKLVGEFVRCVRDVHDK